MRTFILNRCLHLLLNPNFQGPLPSDGGCARHQGDVLVLCSARVVKSILTALSSREAKQLSHATPYHASACGP